MAESLLIRHVACGWYATYKQLFPQYLIVFEGAEYLRALPIYFHRQHRRRRGGCQNTRRLGQCVLHVSLLRKTWKTHLFSDYNHGQMNSFHSETTVPIWLPSMDTIKQHNNFQNRYAFYIVAYLIQLKCLVQWWTLLFLQAQRQMSERRGRRSSIRSDTVPSSELCKLFICKWNE